MSQSNETKTFIIKDRTSCVNALNKLEGIFMVKYWDVAIEHSCPVSFDEKPTDEHLQLKRIWQVANKRAKGHLLQYLSETDANMCRDYTAMNTQLYLKGKYMGDKDHDGLHEAMHVLRSVNILDNDTITSATDKINKVADAPETLNRLRLQGERIFLFSDISLVSLILDMLPQSMAMLRQSWLEKDVSDESYLLLRFKAALSTFYSTFKSTSCTARPDKSSKTSESKEAGRPAKPDSAEFQSFCKPCQKRHPRGDPDCKSFYSQQTRRLDALDKNMMLLLKGSGNDSTSKEPKLPFYVAEITQEATTASKSKSKKLYKHTLDSAANRCYYSSVEFLHNLVKFNDPKPLQVALPTGSSLKCSAVARGELRIPLQSGTTLCIPEAYYVPSLSYNLLSEASLDVHGFTIRRGNRKAEIFSPTQESLVTFPLDNDIFLYEKVIPPSRSGIANSSPRPATLSKLRVDTVSSQTEALKWHLRLGCLPLRDMITLSRISENMPTFDTTVTLPWCDSCIIGKHVKTPATSTPGTPITTTAPLQLIHSDICGPFSESLGKSHYFITFIDDWSRYCVIFLLSRKSQALSAFQKFVTASEMLHGRKVLTVKSDNGGEYLGEFASFMECSGIQWNPVAAFTPSLNGVAERMNRTLANRYLPMLATSQLPDRFWAEALRMANACRNRSPCATIDKLTPYQKWFGFAPDLARLKLFGCVAWAMLPKQARDGKLDTKSIKCINLGFFEEARQYRLFEPTTSRILLSRDVKFDEKSFIKLSPDACVADSEYRTLVPPSEVNVLGKANPYKLEKTDLATQGNRVGLKAFLTSTEVPDVCPPRVQDALDSVGDSRSALLLSNKEVLKAAYDCTQTDPSNYKQAMSSLDAAEWQAAMEKEMLSMEKMGIFKVIDGPPPKKPVGARWVYKTKRDGNGDPISRKSHLVAQGFSQIEGIDFEDTFAPVARMTSTKIVLAFAASIGATCHNLDYDTAFLNGDLEEDIYIILPQGCGRLSGMTVMVMQALYGLRQSGRVWYLTVDKAFKKIGWRPVHSDPCIYVHVSGSILALHVDDMLLAPREDRVSVVALKSDLMNLFKCKDLGACTSYLGCDIVQSDGLIKMHCGSMVKQLLAKYGMENCNSVSTPMEPGI